MAASEGSCLTKTIDQAQIQELDFAELAQAERNVQQALADVPRLVSGLCRELETVEAQTAKREQAVLMAGGPADDEQLAALRNKEAEVRARLREVNSSELKLRALSTALKEELGQRAMEFDRRVRERCAAAWLPETEAQIEDAVEALAFCVIALASRDGCNPEQVDLRNVINVIGDRLGKRIQEAADKERREAREEIKREHPRLG
jgi:hypothetical protein